MRYRSSERRSNHGCCDRYAAFSPTAGKAGVDDTRVARSPDPAEPLDRAAELVGVHARVALGGVEVLVWKTWPSCVLWSRLPCTPTNSACSVSGRRTA